MVFCAGGLTLAFFLWLLKKATPNYGGQIRWALGNVSITLGLLLQGLPVLPVEWKAWIQDLMANGLLVLGVSFIGNGTWQFLDKPKKYSPWAYAPPVVLLPFLYFFTFVKPCVLCVTATVSFFLLVQFIASSIAMAYQFPFARKMGLYSVLGAFIPLSIFFFLRLLMIFDPGMTIFGVNPDSFALTLVSMTVGGTLWTLGFILLSLSRLGEELTLRNVDENRQEYNLLVRTIIDSLPQALVIKDLEGRFMLCNASFAKTLGKSMADVIGTNDFDQYPEDLALKFRGDDKKVLEGGESQIFFEEYPSPGGRIWVETVKIPVQDREGQKTGILVMFRDVTERIEAQEALQESERRYRELSEDLEARVEKRTEELGQAKRDIDIFFEVTLGYLCIVDRGGHFLKVSPSWTADLGWKESDLVGAQILSFLHPDDRKRAVDAVTFLLSGVQLKDFHLRFRRADGTWVWFSLGAVGIPDRRVIIIAAYDITMQVEIEERLRNARLEAERASQAKSQFIATMSHELRTPLNAILGYSALLEQMVQSDRGKGYLKSIGTSGRALLAIINDILDLTRAESGRIELVPMPFEIRGLLNDLADIFRFNVEEKGLVFNFHVTDRVPKTVMLDRDRLRQVLVNLVGNAIKFTDEGSVSLSIDAVNDESIPVVENERVSRKVRLKLEIADTGIGITEEYRRRLFDPFSQQDPSISRKYGGTGLGLAIAKRLLDLMGGQIRYDAPPDGGSRFKIEIPQVISAGNGEEISSMVGKIEEPVRAELPLAEGNSHSLRVLWIKKGTSIGDSLEQFLLTQGLDLTTRAYAPLSRKMLNRTDLLLLSIRWGEPADMDYVKQVNDRARDAEVPILYIIENPDWKAISTYFNATSWDFIRSPVEEEELYARILNLIQIHRAQADLELVNRKLSEASRTIEEKNSNLEILVSRLDRLSLTDELTGLSNRRCISNRVNTELARSKRTGRSLALIMGDLDLFKLVNDRYGHLAGDAVLSESAKRIAESLREGDAVGRWGGEEFLIILPETDLQAAKQVAERIRTQVGTLPIAYGAESIYITISLGVATLIPTEKDDTEGAASLLIRAADDALYRAKARGRNRVEALGVVSPNGTPGSPNGRS
jgi:diguanylate cyclase (GGDEF)-like protein/PAS domain S-box-containing protein